MRIAATVSTAAAALALSAMGGVSAVAAAAGSITGYAPSFAPVGSVVEIDGTGLSGATAVAFDGVTAASMTVMSDTQVDATVPRTATSGPVTVTTPSAVLTGPIFTVQRPTKAAISRSVTSVDYPGRAIITATITSGGKPVGGQPAGLQSAAVGSSSWHPSESNQMTPSNGVVSWTVRPGAATMYRVVFGATPSYQSVTTAATRIYVRPLVSVTATNVSYVDTTFPINGVVSPAPAADSAVTLQHWSNGAWREAGTAPLDSLGRYHFSVSVPSTTTFRYRVSRAPDASHWSGTSARVAVLGADRSLGSGASGSDVSALQQRLATLDYDVGDITGTFNDDTLHAVVAFEKINGLQRDGAVGRTVWKHLNRPVIPHLLHPLADVVAVEVDLTKDVLYYAVNGQISRILDTSTGGGYQYSEPDGSTHTAITPTGHFQVVYKVNKWVKSPLGELYRPAYFNNQGYAIHGDTSVPSYPASHGCVRVTVSAQDRLYPELDKGTSVWIYRS